MRKVYEDRDMMMVGFYRSFLENAGVATVVRNEFASSVAGEIPFTQVYPELWVSDEADYERSVDLIRSIRDSQVSENGSQTPVNYERSMIMRAVLRLGTLLVVLLLAYVGFSIIQALLQ